MIITKKEYKILNLIYDLGTQKSPGARWQRDSFANILLCFADGHTPFMGALPTYLIRLVTEVNWESEKECFDTFSRQTAIFYSQPNPDKTPESLKAEEWKQEHIIFPAIRKNFLPPTSFVHNGAILQIASLNDLYKVFERCWLFLSCKYYFII